MLNKPQVNGTVLNSHSKCAVIDSEATAKKLKEKYPSQFGDMGVRYACWCLDRDDDNTLKILDMPISVARAIGNREALVGKKVAGLNEGCDWKILSNGKSGKEVRYEAVFIKETPLTEAEIETIKAKKADTKKHFDLRKIFKSSSFEEAEEKLFA